MSRNLTWFGICALIIGFVFLYIPIAVLVVYSFNDSEFVTLWTGFSFRAYIALYKNQGYWASTLTTIEVALISSVIATMLGLMIALSLSRLRHFPTRSLFSGLAIAPMVLPEVITGLALLLIFIALGIDRGLLTIVIAHVTFSMCFVAVVITARLAEFDLSLEEAARDLGAGPVAAFFLVTLPVIAPAVVTGFLLAFTISLDSLVLSSFTSGPGTTTLPMRVYSEVKRGVSPEINALSTIIILVVTVVAITVALYTKKASTQPFDSELRP